MGVTSNTFRHSCAHTKQFHDASTPIPPMCPMFSSHSKCFAPVLFHNVVTNPCHQISPNNISQSSLLSSMQVQCTLLQSQASTDTDMTACIPKAYCSWFYPLAKEWVTPTTSFSVSHCLCPLLEQRHHSSCHLLSETVLPASMCCLNTLLPTQF